MALLTYDELLIKEQIESSTMEQIIQNSELVDLSFKLDRWEVLAYALDFESSDIENIRSCGNMVEQRLNMLQRWKQRNVRATYEVLTRAMLRIRRADLAVVVAKMASSRASSNDQKSTVTDCTRSSLRTSHPLASSNEIIPLGPLAPKFPVHTCYSSGFVIAPSACLSWDIRTTIHELEGDFHELLIQIERILEENGIKSCALVSRFRCLPESVKRQHQTDRKYTRTRRRILNSVTIRELFDNLTELKNWNFMMPETLYEILRDVHIEDIHKKVQDYRDKLSAFKASTKLKDLIGISFMVPDYCIRLTMKVEGWENKTIDEAERAACNTLRCYAMPPGHPIRLGYEKVSGGCVELTYILLESMNLQAAMCTKHEGVVTIELDDNILYSDDHHQLKDEASGNKGSSQLRPSHEKGKTKLHPRSYVESPSLSVPAPSTVCGENGLQFDHPISSTMDLKLKFVDSIKRKYKERRLNREKQQWPICKSNRIIDLKLVKRKRCESHQSTKLNLKNDITRSPLTYHDLLKQDDRKAPIRKILVEGDAGIGKTTFCTQVSELWANGELFEQFDIVLLLPLRHKRVASAGTLFELLRSLNSDQNLCRYEASYLEESEGEKTLIIADGWDELSESHRNQESFMYELLFGNTLPFVSALVTSRPYASSSLHEDTCIDRYVELCGFSETTLKEYIQSEFQDDHTKASRLIEQLENNPIAASICQVPLNSAIVCHLWHVSKETLPATLTELYNKITLNIILREMKRCDSFKHVKDLKSLSNLPKELQQPFTELCKFSFETVRQKKLVFSEEDLNTIFPQGINMILCFGLLQSSLHLLETGVGTAFHFPHQTFQEYLAALHLANLPADKQKEIFKSIHSQFLPSKDFLPDMVWRFYFGIYYNNATGTGEVTTADSQLCSLEVLKSIRGELFFCGLNKSILFCHCAFEARQESVTKNVIKLISGSGGFGARMKINDTISLPMMDAPSSDHDCAAMLYVYSNLQSQSLEVNFEKCSVRENQIKTLAYLLQQRRLQVSRLFLNGNKLSDSTIANLFQKAARAFSALSELDLGSNAIGPESLECIAKALKPSQSSSNNASLERLDLSCNSLRVCDILMLIWSGSLASLRCLSLQRSFYDDPSVHADSESLTKIINSVALHCQHLQILDLSQNNFKVVASSALALRKLLTKCKVMLLGPYPYSKIVDVHHPVGDKIQLCLSETSLKDENLVKLVQGLETSCSFSRLELDKNGITCTAISCLADSICSGRIVIKGDHESLDSQNYAEDDEEYQNDLAMDIVDEAMDYVNLQLDDNSLGLNGLTAIINMLGSSNFRPKLLSLEGCELTTLDDDLDKDVQLEAKLETIGKQLCQLSSCNSSSITHLYLDRNVLTRKGTHVLAGFICMCPLLDVLSTCSCCITSNDLINTLETIVELKPSIVLRFLTWDLLNNKIDDTGVALLINKLQKSSLFGNNVRYIRLQGNPASESLIMALKEELEHIQKKAVEFIFREYEMNTSIEQQLASGTASDTPALTSESTIIITNTQMMNTDNEDAIGQSEASLCHPLPEQQPVTSCTHVSEEITTTESQRASSPLHSFMPLPDSNTNYPQSNSDVDLVDHDKRDTNSQKSAPLMSDPSISSPKYKDYLLRKPTLHELEYLEGKIYTVEVIEELAYHWKEIATYLHFEFSDIERIENNCHYLRVDASWQIFREWLEGKGQEPVTWEALIKVLYEAELTTLAKKLEIILDDQASSKVNV